VQISRKGTSYLVLFLKEVRALIKGFYTWGLKGLKEIGCRAI
jgi:hypothetical protein